MNGIKCMMAALLLVLSGCASMDAVYKNYADKVDTSDGVGEEEAKIMAQKDILNTEEKRNYRITAPDIKSTPQALKYEEYWFVVFGHNWFSPISTDPNAKTYTELRETQYLVVIKKSSGKIIFSGEWFQKRENDFEWVFDMEGYKRKNPLSLPPGRSGHQAL